MTEHHDHRDDCPFKFATLDVCDCVEKNMLDRIKALTKERDDAREYAGEVRKREMAAEDARISATDKLATCEKYRDAYAEMDRIGTQAVRDLEAKLAKALEALEVIRDRQYYRMGPGVTAQVIARATIAEIKGESHD